MNIPSEHVLLHRMQNVNISSDNVTEFWNISDIPEIIAEYPKQSECPGLYYNFCLNAEEEIYVKGNTAVWSKG